MTSRSQWAALAAALALLSAGPGCRGPCASMEPAVQVTVQLDDPSLRDLVKWLDVTAEVTPRGTDASPSQNYPVTDQLDDGQTSFVIYPGDTARGGFSATVTVTARDANRALVAQGDLSGRFSGDACNLDHVVHLKRASSPEGGPDGPRDLGSDTPRFDLSADLRADKRRAEAKPPDGPPPQCGAPPNKASPACQAVVGWTNRWPVAVEPSTATQCKVGPTTFDTTGQDASPFLLGGCATSQIFDVPGGCKVMVRASRQCGDSCLFHTISYAFSERLYNNWTHVKDVKGEDECDTGCTTWSKDPAYQYVTPPGVDRIRITAYAPFKACVYAQ